MLHASLKTDNMISYARAKKKERESKIIRNHE